MDDKFSFTFRFKDSGLYRSFEYCPIDKILFITDFNKEGQATRKKLVNSETNPIADIKEAILKDNSETP